MSGHGAAGVRRDGAAPCDFLSDAVAYVRPCLMRSGSVGDRLRTLWAGVKAARDLAAADVVEDEFLQLAHDTGLDAELTAHVGRDADADLRHVIGWAMRDMNPFNEASL